MSETDRRAMTPQDLTRIHTASDPQIAPDGRQLQRLPNELGHWAHAALQSRLF